MMLRSTLLASLSLAVISLPACAGHHADGEPDPSIDEVLASEIRADDAARDQFRNPKETLEFFGVTSSSKVAEYSPGGGWYTRVLAPLTAEDGQYVAIGADVEAYFAGADEERIAKAKAWDEDFPARVTEWTGIEADKITAFEIDEAPEEAAGSMDAILVFRSMHGLQRRNIGDDTIRHFYGLLKSGGVVGVVQHRAKEDAPYDYTRGHNGYLKQSEIIALFESEGFELAGTSEVNANANDTADYEGGVWTIPPVLRGGDAYKDIGESDRMTLTFKKP